MKRILIIEDEMLIASILQKYVEQAGYECIGIAIDYAQAIKLINNKQIDFIFLDITIKGEKTGIDIADYINLKKPIPFIYLTSHSDIHTLDKVAVTKPIAYLSKPFKAIDITTALKLYFNDNKGSTFKLSLNKTYYYINLKELLYAESDHVYINLFFNKGHLKLRVSLSKLIEQLPKNTLIRINRSVAVNPKIIRKIDKKDLFISDKKFKTSLKYFEEYKHLLE